MNSVSILGAKKKEIRYYICSRQISKSFAFLHLFLLFSTMLIIPVSKAQLRAAVVKEDITPSDSQYLLGYGERKSTGVLDHIYHRIVAIDDGKTQFFIVSTDLCLYSPSEYDKITARLQKEYGIDPLNVWWTTTHTHSAPEVGAFGLYGIYLGNRIGHAVDSVSQANINRRAIDENGKASLGMNPDLPVDRRIGLIRLDKEDGTPLVLLANYAMHGTVMSGANLDISGDAPGVVAEYVEQKTGVPMLYINGAAGNMAPIYSVYPNAKAGHLSQFKVLLGDKILEANKKIEADVDSIKLVTGSLTVKTPRKHGMEWSSDLSKYTSTTKAGVNMVKLPVRFLKINKDIVIWSAPIELFCEVSNEVRSRSPFPFTFYFGYTNGWLGYMPTESAWPHGGYEVETVSPFTPSAAKDLTESVVGYLQGELQAERSPAQTKPKPKRRRETTPAR